jgi:hypothetical protein
MDISVETDIEIMVLILAIYKKNENETLIDIIKTLENSRVFSFKEGKRLLKLLKNNNFILNEELTIIGIQKAQEAQKAFTV